MRRRVLCCTAALLASCSAPDGDKADTAIASALPTVLPAPFFMQHDPGARHIAGRIVIDVPRDVEAADTTAWFRARMTEDFGVETAIGIDDDQTADIVLARVNREAIETALAPHAGDDGDGAWREGAYLLDARGERVTISAAGDAGFFYGLTTLWQLLSRDGEVLRMPRSYVADTPRFAWRGLMLDSARHLQSPAFVRQYVDWMALHKLNVLHWHLTDDQAWRIEIEAYPELTRTGAWRTPAHLGAAREPLPRYGGYFTQDDVRGIVAYAAARHVTVVPEIDVPGHTTAAIAAYPELGVAGHAVAKVPASWGIYDNVLNFEDGTLRFFENVLREILALFPSRFVHLGGDEVVMQQWLSDARTRERMAELGIDDEQDLQRHHFGALQRFLAAHGRRAIGWDEIVEGELPADAAVMSWRGTAGGIEAARAGHDVVLSPAPTLYLDHLQSAAADAPPGRGGVMSLRDVYDFEPLPAELAPYRDQVLGVQGNLWTEHVRTEQRVEYMSYPRAAAIAELGWSRAASRDWPAFVARLAQLFLRYERLGLDAADAAFAVRIDARRAAGDTVIVELGTPSGFGRVRYTTDGSEPDGASPEYAAPLELALPVTVSARGFHEGTGIGHTRTARIDALSLLHRDDRELELCSERIVLALEDDAPADGPRASFLVDIMNPCWMLRDVEVSAIGGLRVSVGQLPFNFEIGDAIEQVVVHEPQSAAGELVVRDGSCVGAVAASLSLAPAAGVDTVTWLPDTPLSLARGGARTDLCFYFTRTGVEPLWVIDQVQLLPAAAQ